MFLTVTVVYIVEIAFHEDAVLETLETKKNQMLNIQYL